MPLRLALLVLLLAPSLAPAAEDAPKVDLSGLRPKVDRLLRDDLQRWYPAAIDREHGGFRENFARDWTPTPDSSRSIVYQSRMTWTASAFAQYAPESRQTYQEIARHGLAFLDRTMRDAQNGGFYWNVNLDGKPSEQKHVYGIAFALYAASTVREATGDDRALKLARDTFAWLEKHAHDAKHGGYFEAFSADGSPLLSWPEGAPVQKRTDLLGVYYGYKSMNSHIHLLEALAAFARVEKVPEVQARLREVLVIVRDKIAVEPGALNLYFTRDWKPVPAHDSFGHDVETAYLLVEAAEAAGLEDDPKTWSVARSLVDHALDWGWDEEFGGFYDKGDSFAGRPYDTTKVWWTQAEGLNALLLMHKKYRRETDRYGGAFLKQWDFIAKHQIDPQHGGWFGEVTREGRLIGDGRKAHPWKANYHTSRALMNVTRMLDEIEKEDRR